MNVEALDTMVFNTRALANRIEDIRVSWTTNDSLSKEEHEYLEKLNPALYDALVQTLNIISARQVREELSTFSIEKVDQTFQL